MADLTITTQDDLPGPESDGPYVMFLNQAEYGIGKFLRTNVLSARPDLKRCSSIRLHVNLKRLPSDSAGEIVQALLEAIDLDSPLPVFCRDIHLEMEGYSMEFKVRLEGLADADRVLWVEEPPKVGKIDPANPQASDHLDGESGEAQRHERPLEGAAACTMDPVRAA